MDRINELSALTFTVGLTDSDGTAAVPTTTEWRLLCITSDTELQVWTTVVPVTTTDDGGNPQQTLATITLSALLHAMQTTNTAIERKALCIAADRGLSTEWNDEIVYEVERLYARS